MTSGDTGGRSPETRRRYRRLLRLFFSSDFVDAHGAEMEATFLRLMQLERERRGRIGVVRVWLGAVADGVRNGWLGRRHRALGIGSQTGMGRGGGAMMDGLWNDLRHALRGFVRAPMFTATAIGTLALGIGAVTSIFAVVHGVLIDPLPFEEPDELVGVWHTAPGWGFDQVPVAVTQWATYREEATSFEEIGLWAAQPSTVTGVGDPERVSAVGVTHEVLSVLGVEPPLGRRFTEDDDAPGAPLTVILDHGYWTTRFGGDPGALGTMLTVSGRLREVVGVLPADFTLPSVTSAGVWGSRQQASLLYPLQLDRVNVVPGGFNYLAVGRLAPGATVEQASAEIDRLIPRASERYGGVPIAVLEAAGFASSLRPLEQDYVGDVGTALWILLGTVAIVLVIACANVANLFLVRMEGRRQEVALRAALGAGGKRIASHLLVESVTLGLLGGLVGLCVAVLGTELLVRAGPVSLPRLENISVGVEVVAVAVGLAVAAGLALGLIAHLQTRAPDVMAAVKEGGRGGGAGRSRGRVRSALVVAQTSAALVLLAGSGLMVRSLQELRSVDPGFADPEQVVTFQVGVPDAEAAGDADVLSTYNRILDGLVDLASVASVGAVSALPMDGASSYDAIYFEDDPLGPDESPPVHRFKTVTGGYFETMRQALVAGRSITRADVDDRRAVVVVSRRFAEERWGSAEAAIGQRITWGVPDGAFWSEIVGVVQDEHDDGVDQPAPAVTYWPAATINPRFPGSILVRRVMSFAVRTTRASPTSLAGDVRDVVASVNPNLAVSGVGTLQDILDRSMARTSFTMVLLLISATAALALGLVGIYGVVSYVVSLRTREIGVRIALGADGRRVARMVMRQGAALSLAGVAIGLIAAAGLTRLMGSLLFGVEPTDPLTFSLVATGLVGISLVASYLPARRVSRTDPVVALRSE